MDLKLHQLEPPSKTVFAGFRRIKIKKIFRLFGFTLITIISGYLYFWISAPTGFKIGTSCYTTRMNGLKVCPQSNNYTSIEKMPTHLIDAVVLAEDAGFFSHNGFDQHEILESFKVNILTASYKRGGSTISQQTVKNLYLSKEKSITRKLHEIFLTQHLEESYSKKKILETYLNIAEFGKDIYGITQAAQKHFYTNPERLTLFQSVYLAHLLPSPKKLERALEEGKHQKESVFRMSTIAKRLHFYKKISNSEFTVVDAQIKNLYTEDPHQ